MGLMQVVCPPGATPGVMIPIETPSGQRFDVAVPEGIAPGAPFQVMVPEEQAAVPMAQAQPVQAWGAPPVQGQPMAQGQPVQGYAVGAQSQAPYPQPYIAPQPYNAPPPTVIYEQPQTVIVHEQPHFYSENYCGPLSLLICLFVPCGFWIACCPIDERVIRVG